VSFEKKNKIIIIRVPDRMKEEIKKVAKKDHSDEAKVVRDAIEEKLDKSK
jgi:predicted DNA-binding protein